MKRITDKKYFHTKTTVLVHFQKYKYKNAEYNIYLSWHIMIDSCDQVEEKISGVDKNL